MQPEALMRSEASSGVSCLLRRPAKRLLAALVTLFALSSLAAHAQTGEGGRIDKAFALPGVVEWMSGRFSESEMQTYRPEDFRVDSQLCNCSDQPVPHFPYILVFFSTPKGDLVGRPDRRGFDTIITPLAVRHGNRYCELDAEDECFGAFDHPCDFSDFRYGEQLAPYFPYCKATVPKSD